MELLEEASLLRFLVVHFNLISLNGHLQIFEQLYTTLEVVTIRQFIEGTILDSETLIIHLGFFTCNLIILNDT